MIKKKTTTEWQQLSLAKAAELLGYKESYLLRLASSGKLKAYKFGQEWLTTKEWINDWKETVKKKVVEENTKSPHYDKWIKHLPEKKKRNYHLKHKIDFSLASLTLSTACILFFVMVITLSQPGENNPTILAMGNILDQRPKVAENFLALTNQVYYFPITIVDKVSGAGIKVLDYSTNYFFFATADMENSLVADVRLLPIAWNSLKAQKIPDENLTGFLRQALARIGLGSWSDKTLSFFGLKQEKGRVAGDSVVWPQ